MTSWSMRYCLRSQRTVNPMIGNPLVLGTGASAHFMPNAEIQQIQMRLLCLFLTSCRYECG